MGLINMDFLKEFGLNEKDINYIKSKYDKKIIASIISMQENVCKLLDYFQENKFNSKTLLINKLDLFLIPFLTVKKKIESYNKEEIMNILQNDFSLLDNIS